MRAEHLTPEFFGSDDPNFNLEAAIAAYSWVMREEEPVAKFVLGDVASNVVYEEVQKNHDGFSAYIRKQAEERKELVKKTLARAVMEGSMSDEALQEAIDAMEVISKAYKWDENKHDRDRLGRFAPMGRTTPTYPKRKASAALKGTTGIQDNRLRQKAQSANLDANDAKEFEAAYMQVQRDMAQLGINARNPADAVIRFQLSNGAQDTISRVGVTSVDNIVGAPDFDAKDKKIIDVEFYETGPKVKVGGNKVASYGEGAPMALANYGALDPASVAAWKGITTAQMMQMQNDPELTGATRGMRNVGNAAALADSLGVGETNPKMKAALAAGKLVGDMGPEAEKVIGPGIRRAAYRYRGTERPKPDKDIMMARDATLRPIAQTGTLNADTVRAAITTPRPVEGTDETYGSPLIRAMQNRLPDPTLVDLHASSGRITPSEGILLDAQGNIQSQAVGNADDHYLPFNLRKISNARGGSYIRTRALGGPTTEDIYTGLMAGLDSMTVVSNSGVYTINFDQSFKGGRRYNDKALRMQLRYGQLVDAVESKKVQLDAIPADRKRELRQQVAEEMPGDTEEVMEQRKQRYAELQNAEKQNPTPSQKQITEWEDEFREQQAEKWSNSPAGEMTWAQVKAQASLQANRSLDDSEAIDELGLRDEMDQFLENKREQYAYDKGPLALNGTGYHKALLAMKEQFPYYIKDVTFIPAGNNRTDLGYIKPRHIRPEKAMSGYFDPSIEGVPYYGPDGEPTGKRRADMDYYANAAAYQRMGEHGIKRATYRGAYPKKSKPKEGGGNPNVGPSAPASAGGGTGTTASVITPGTATNGFYKGFQQNPRLKTASEGTPYQKAMAAVKMRQKIRGIDKLNYRDSTGTPRHIYVNTDNNSLRDLSHLMGVNAANMSDDQFLERMMSDQAFADQVNNEIVSLNGKSGSSGWEGALSHTIQNEMKFFVGETYDNPTSPQILVNRLVTRDKKMYDFTQPARRIDGRNYLPGQPKNVYEAAWKADSDISRFTAQSSKRFGYNMGLGQDPKVFNGITAQFGQSMQNGLNYVDQWRRQAKEFGGARNIPDKTVVEYGGKKYSAFSANDLERDISQDALALSKMKQLKAQYDEGNNGDIKSIAQDVKEKTGAKTISIDANLKDPERQKDIQERGLVSDRSRRTEYLDKSKKTLDGMTGLESVKGQVNTLIDEAKVNEKRKEAGLPVKQSTNHLIFTGAPGTGKTTVARALGDAYYGMGITKKPEVVAVSRADLVGEYQGETSKKTRTVFDKAKGGVLFIDEAYSLVSSSGDQYGFEALDELMQFAENNREDTVVILAGYPDSMENLLEANPGMKSRFPKTISFPNYSADEINQIQGEMLSGMEYALEPAAQKQVTAMAGKIVSLPNYSNARDARNFNDSLRRAHARRISRLPEDKLTETALKTITADDVDNASKEFLGTRTGT